MSKESNMELNYSPLPWHACNNGECSCKQVWIAEHPVAKVTSGNWGDDYPSIRLIGSSSLGLTAEPYMEQITYGEVSEKTAVANARLIATAPELYEVLKKLTERLSQNGGIIPLCAKLVLKKAEGNESDS